MLILILGIVVRHAPAQETANRVKADHVVLVTLYPPAYPPLARTADITGQVKIDVLIKKDNSIESARVISGHPMLDQAVLDSVNKSKFECRQCSGEDSFYTLTYTFKIVEPTSKCDCTISTPQVSQVEDQVAITAGPMCVVPTPCESAWVAAHDRFRSAKCLYLWKCGDHHTVLY